MPNETTIEGAVPAQNATSGQSSVQLNPIRDKVRLLIITTDTTVTHEGSALYTHLVDICNAFLEIHVAVLASEPDTKKEIVRLFETVWVYRVPQANIFTRLQNMHDLLQKELVFNGEFRADVILALDPYESGAFGLFLSKKYTRPYQVHIQENFLETAERDGTHRAFYYEWVAEYVYKHARSIRTHTEYEKQILVAAFPNTATKIDVLPHYYNLNLWRDMTPGVDVRVLYPRFKFVLVHVSSLRVTSHTEDVLHATAPILRRYPTIGLVIIGDGPLRSQCEKLAIALGVQGQVEFVPSMSDMVSLLKTSQLLIYMGGVEDSVVCAAAAVKVPIISVAEGIIPELFADGESIRICDPSDHACITRGINLYLNENQIRLRFTLAAYESVFNRLEQDYGAYIGAYVASIESCMVTTID